jgi:AcrR family transcriptional regulator
MSGGTISGDAAHRADNDLRSGAMRMPAHERMASIVLEADRQINERRSARISPADLASDLGTSRSLVYSYFPNTDRLIDAVLDRHAQLLIDAGLGEALRADTLEQAMIRSADIYCDHVIEHGSAIELCLREPRLTGRLGSKMRPLVMNSLRRLARLVMKELQYGPAEALALVRILQVLPEDTARLVKLGTISREGGQRVCARLMSDALNELRPA